MSALQTVVIGLGHCGAQLHVPVLRRIRPADRPLFGYDSRTLPVPPGVVPAGSLPELARLADPDRSVVHLCTPPGHRVEPMETLARLGFRRFLVEKPLAGDEIELAALERLRAGFELDLVVVAQWLTSTLCARLTAMAGEAGPRSTEIVLHKPRFARSLTSDGHHSAFDVEVPHAVGLALHLAGPGRITAAGCDDLVCEAALRPRMGAAWLAIEHDGGGRTGIWSDLTAPTRERRVTLDLGHRTVIGHFPVSADDPHAQLWTDDREVFRDDALEAFFRRAYDHFDGGPGLDTLTIGRGVVRLLEQARKLAFAVPA